jgi:hypothetical protein
MKDLTRLLGLSRVELQSICDAVKRRRAPKGRRAWVIAEAREFWWCKYPPRAYIHVYADASWEAVMFCGPFPDGPRKGGVTCVCEPENF